MGNLVFLWHMHQPYYVDSCSGCALMPWVRLHCQKGYLDMISLMEDYPAVRATFNLSPVLLLQINEMVKGRVVDQWMQWARKPATALDTEERFALLEHYFKLNWETMVRPLPRFWELLNKRGLTFYRDEVRRGLRYFSAQEFRDLQTLFNLAWCGYTAQRLYPELAELRKKGRLFTEEEKHRVLDIHMEIMGTILDKYRAGEERGQVELTTSPFFHPILPLIYDSDLASRALPGRPLPKRFHYPHDAQAQLGLAVEQHASLFGKAPRGLWPSEGGVAPELIPLMKAAGIEYFCSDEEVLLRSLGRERRAEDVFGEPQEVFEPWEVAVQGASVHALFRHRALSDYIGFMAVRREARQSAAYLMDHLRHLASRLPSESGVIPLFLDGENAWEQFPDGGETFLRAFYAELEASQGQLACSTIEGYLQAHPPKRRVEHLHTGSWIGADFDIWIGEPEENRAWDLLGKTREFLQHQIDLEVLDGAQECKAKREMYAAEGSDWFWWYGPDFSTGNDTLFDELFRIHLRNVYAICGQMAPAALGRTLIGNGAPEVCSSPRGLIHPRMEGRQSSFFDWTGAGVFKPASPGAHGRDIVRALHFGNDTAHFFLRIDLVSWTPLGVAVEFRLPQNVHLRISKLKANGQESWVLERADGSTSDICGFGTGQNVDLSVPLAELGLKPGAPISFQVRLFVGDSECACLPQDVPIEFRLLDEEAVLANWRV